MPIYIYKCPKCKTKHDVIKSTKDIDKPVKCFVCGSIEYRVIGKTYLKFNTKMS